MQDAELTNSYIQGCTKQPMRVHAFPIPPQHTGQFQILMVKPIPDPEFPPPTSFTVKGATGKKPWRLMGTQSDSDFGIMATFLRTSNDKTLVIETDTKCLLQFQLFSLSLDEVKSLNVVGDEQ